MLALGFLTIGAFIFIKQASAHEAYVLPHNFFINNDGGPLSLDRLLIKNKAGIEEEHAYT